MSKPSAAGWANVLREIDKALVNAENAWHKRRTQENAGEMAAWKAAQTVVAKQVAKDQNNAYKEQGTVSDRSGEVSNG